MEIKNQNISQNNLRELVNQIIELKKSLEQSGFTEKEIKNNNELIALMNKLLLRAQEEVVQIADKIKEIGQENNKFYSEVKREINVLEEKSQELFKEIRRAFSEIEKLEKNFNQKLDSVIFEGVEVLEESKEISEK